MKKKTIKKTVKIKATLKVLARDYTAEGKTLVEVLSKLKPPVAKTLGILTLEKGELKKEKILQPRIVMGLWGKQSQTMKDVAFKRIKLIFNDFD